MNSLAKLTMFVAVAGLLGVATVAQAAPTPPCDPEILLPGGACPPDSAAAAAQCCPCDAFSNHGQYVRCTAHAVNLLRQAACLDADAGRSMKKCAARSTCGKPGFVTCCLQRPGVCRDSGVCAQTEPPVQCTVDEDCPPRVKCSIKDSADRCLAIGGTPGAAASCCDACQAP